MLEQMPDSFGIPGTLGFRIQGLGGFGFRVYLNPPNN